MINVVSDQIALNKICRTNSTRVKIWVAGNA
jgi:hypothetical protein